MIHTVGLLAPLVIAAVLAVSALAKLRAPRAAADSFVSLRLPSWLSNSIAPRLLPWGELVLALAVLVLPGPLGVLAWVAALVLMLIYLVLIVRALGFGEPVDCGCFGELGMGEVTRATAVRNGLLVLMAALGLVAAVADGRAPLARWGHASIGDGAWLGMVVMTGALAVLIRGGSGPASVSSADRDASVAEADHPEEGLDYVRAPTPYAMLQGPEGNEIPVREIGRRQATLLVFVRAHCAPCHRTLEQVPGWTQRLHPVVGVRPVFTSSSPDELTDATPVVSAVAEQALFDPEARLLRMLGVSQTPSAVLLGVDDLLAGGPVAGENAVQAFVEDVIAQLVDAQQA